MLSSPINAPANPLAIKRTDTFEQALVDSLDIDNWVSGTNRTLYPYW